MTAVTKNSLGLILGALFWAASTMSLVDAFVVGGTVRSPTATPRGKEGRLFLQRLSEIDEMCIENVAEYCLKAESALENQDCDVEEYEALVNQLRDQRKILGEQLDYVDSLLVKLQAGPNAASAADGSDKKETYFAG